MDARAWLVVLLGVLALSAAGCGDDAAEEGAVISFSSEEDPCASTETLFIDADDGAELKCEGSDYDGPLASKEKTEVTCIISELAHDDPNACFKFDEGEEFDSGIAEVPNLGPEFTDEEKALVKQYAEAQANDETDEAEDPPQSAAP